jgi:hypothetical protein
MFPPRQALVTIAEIYLTDGLTIANRIDGKSCTSAKLVIAFSWISTINREKLSSFSTPVLSIDIPSPLVFMYLIFLVISAILHQKQDATIWSAQVRTYPWYRHFYCHKIASSPEITRPPDHVPVAAPRPWRPIRLPTRSILSSLYQVEPTHDRQSGITEPRGPPPMMQEAKPGPTALYPLFIRAAVLEPTIRPSPRVESSLSPGFDHSQQHLRHPLPDVGVPPPLWDWPRADIMSLPPPRRTATRKASVSSLPSAIDPSHERGGGLPRGLPSTSM